MTRLTSPASWGPRSILASVAPEETFTVTQWPTTLLMRPLPIAAAATLLLNDHVLKHCVPSVLTGKLSDLAGLFFFPLLLVTLFNLLMLFVSSGWPVASAWATPRVRQVELAIAATALVFTWLQLSPSSPSQWAAVGRVFGMSWANTPDPTDLFALPVLAATRWHAQRCVRWLPPGRVALLRSVPGQTRTERVAAAHLLVEDVIELGSDEARVWWSQLLDDVVDGRDPHILDEHLAFLRAESVGGRPRSRGRGGL